MTQEINLLAQFTFPERAQDCADALQRHGFDVVQIDQLPSEAGPQRAQVPVVEWGRYGYQPNIVDDKWTQTSSWDNPQGFIDGEAWLLTAVVDEDAVELARHIIKAHGGIL